MATYYINDVIAEVKLLDKRINKKISELDLDRLTIVNIVSDKKKAEMIEFGNRARESYQSVTDLITTRHKLKTALIKFNAGCPQDYPSINTIKVIDKDYTVAEIIERRLSLQYEKNLLSCLTDINREWERKLVDATSRYNDNLRDFIKSQVEVAQGDKTKAMEHPKVSEWIAQYAPSYEPHRLDPIGLIKEIDRLTDYIDSVSTGLDTALSRLNATCTIEV